MVLPLVFAKLIQRKTLHRASYVLSFLACLGVFCPLIQAQVVASGMTGVVTDASGAVVPGVVVTLTNKTTGLTFTQTTNAAGLYRFSDIPPGQGYEAIFKGPSFAPVDIKNIYLTVATIRTQDASLTPGSSTEVEVTASNSEVTIDTTDATVGNTFDVKQLNNLPVQQRNDPTALFTMQPGVTDTASVAGARSDQNNITLDGLDVNDFVTGGSSQTASGITQGFSIVGHAPVDSVEEFRGTVAGLGAAAGPSSGGQFQLVTKSGTNSFHGNINEYHRDPLLVANSWFSNNASPIVPRNHLIQNQFGGNIGGPILKNKLFFFFDYNNSRVISSILQQRAVPLDSLRSGNVGYNNASGAVTYLTPAQIKALDPQGIGEDTNWVAAFNSRFPHSNSSILGDGINSGGFSFNAPDNDYETNYVGRGDYNLTDKMKIFARFTIARENAIINPNEFAGDPATNPFVDRTYAFVIGHTWVIGANKTNQFFLGETVEKYAYPNDYNPAGSTYFTFGDGADNAIASGFYLQPSSQARRVPIPVIGDDFTWTKGNHTLQMGGTFKDILAHTTNVADYNTTEIGLGGYLFSLCGPTPGDCGYTGVTPNPSLRPSSIDPSNTLPYDEAFAFMLARVANVQSDYNFNAAGKVLPQLTGDQRFYRNYQTQLYVSDTWKALPSLSLSFGLNYQFFSVPYETRGLESTEPFTFDQYFSARVSQSALAETGPQAVPLITYYLGGKANNGPPLYQPEYKDLAPRFGFAFNPGFDKKSVFNGSVGVVYDRTVIAAIQAIQDVDSYLFQQTKPTPEGVQNNPYASVKQDPRLDKNNGISTVPLTPPATPTPPYQPFTVAGMPNGLQNGLAFNATIDPSLKTPYSISFNAGWQRSLPKDMIVKLSYVGREGRRLLAQADANQIIDFPDTVSGQLLSQAFAAVTKQVRAGVSPSAVTPQPFFKNVIPAGTGVAAGFANNTQYLVAGNSGFVRNGDFGDFVQAISSVAPPNVGSAAQFSENTFYTNKGFSSYNAMLLTLQRNLSHGLQYDFNYTFAHSIDNVSFFANSEGDTGIGGVGLVCDVLRPRECRADSDFDERQYITADATYELPVGRHRALLADSPLWVNEIIGGWDISGVTAWHTGQAWGTASNAYDASYSNDAPAIFIGSNKSVISPHVTKLKGGGVSIFSNAKAAAASYEGPIGFQIGPRNSLHGPHFFDADLGLAKTFPIVGERLNFKFRADAFNAFNHPNFGLPLENAFNGYDQQDYQQGSSFGKISYTVSPSGNTNNGARVLQVSGRLEF
jgi:hypothetical protein